MYFELVYCWFSKRIPNLNYCWFSSVKDAIGKSGEGIICCPIIWTRDLLMLMALIFESLLFVLWSTVACTWVVVVIWTMIKDFTVQFFISLHFTVFVKITSSCFIFIVYKHADASLRNSYFDSQVSDHRHTRCIWILKFVFNHHCLQPVNVCLLICVCVFSLKEYAYILN